MLIVPEPATQKKIAFRIRMNVKTHEEIMKYCQWAGITYRDFFIEEACKYILANDKKWNAYKQSKQKTIEDLN
ncbi:Uncharacterised protein [Legionella beliardensis]|uniref:CopG family transcriptional regulator n=1 Tax=Legionella beliardensis TaxID=91822 RepID=A0A378I5E0_9GAMM|nr:hypothetical protein [Legionella beliardensis]STX30062.1 Uncharacterised protein [Legionella beliardensis]